MRNDQAELIAEHTLGYDAWLTAIMELPVWRVESGDGGVAFSALASSEPVFAYAKCDVTNIGMVSALCDLGFRVVDTAVILEGVINSEAISTGDAARYATAADRDAVRDIAGKAFRFSRFHLDPLVPVRVADEIKASWADNYFVGKRGDRMIVAEHNGRIVGFLQLLWGHENTLIIDLIGIAPEFHRRGFGRAMILFAARHGMGDQRRPSRISVGTQIANVPSMRLYEKLGLRLRCAQYVLHFHGAVTRLEE